MLQAPPIGLRPVWLHNIERRYEILDAFGRYVSAQKRIPEEWLQEFAALNDQLQDEAP